MSHDNHTPAAETLTATRVGRRTYFTGNTARLPIHAFNRLHYDADRKAWWTGSSVYAAHLACSCKAVWAP